MARFSVLCFLLVLFILVACAPANPATPTPGLPATLEATIVLGTPTATVDPASHPRTSPQPELIAGTQTITGVVLSGGDTTPKNLLDAPRTFIYQVQLENGNTIDVKYIAYPPSPAGDRKQILVEFDAGGIKVGNYIEAHGNYNPSTNTLFAEAEGDYIKTLPSKP